MKTHNLTCPSTRRYSSSSPFSSSSHRSELDVSSHCDDVLTGVYQSMVEVLRWIVELGRIDIQLEISLLSQFLAQPRMGHLSQACNIFCYLKTRYSKGFSPQNGNYMNGWSWHDSLKRQGQVHG